MGKIMGTLQPYQPTFEIDDGFRLTIEPTFEALQNDVRRFYASAAKAADIFTVSAFLCGVSLLRARDIVPKAPRGPQAGRYSGFDAWKRKTFPDLSEDALGRYLGFASAVFAEVTRLKSVGTTKTALVRFLSTGYRD